MLRTDIGYAGSCSPDWLGVRLDYVVMAYGSLCMIKREMLLADRDRFLPTEDVRYVYLDFSLHMSTVFEDTKPSRFRRTFSKCGDGLQVTYHDAIGGRLRVGDSTAWSRRSKQIYILECHHVTAGSSCECRLQHNP